MDNYQQTAEQYQHRWMAARNNFTEFENDWANSSPLHKLTHFVEHYRERRDLLEVKHGAWEAAEAAFSVASDARETVDKLTQEIEKFRAQTREQRPEQTQEQIREPKRVPKMEFGY